MSHDWIERRLPAALVHAAPDLARLRKLRAAGYSRHVLLFSIPQAIAHAEALIKLTALQQVFHLPSMPHTKLRRNGGTTSCPGLSTIAGILPYRSDVQDEQESAYDIQRVRRQRFLVESYVKDQMGQFAAVLNDSDGLEANLLQRERQRGWHASLARGVGFEKFNRLLLRYTAGEDCTALRPELGFVIEAYERYGTFLWKDTQDRNEPVFEFTDLDAYCQLMQTIGLCFLLHRRNLLPRIAALQDGQDGRGNGGCDTLYEEFMAFGIGPETRFETDLLCQVRPYENLFYALTELEPTAQLKELDLFLKHWYKDLAGTAWHDSHKPDEHGNQGGYYGYWSFEAGAAVLLLGIEDDSSLHKYLYYPKDMVAWARAQAALSAPAQKADLRLRAAAGEPCPRTGFWVTPVAQNTRRRFDAGDLMPDLQSGYGATIWQWDTTQD